MTPFRTALSALLAVAGVAAATAAIAQGADLPDAPGKAQVMESCTQCHGTDVIAAQRRSPEDWTQVVSQMVGNGASLTDDQYQAVVAYLSASLGPPAPAPAASH